MSDRTLEDTGHNIQRTQRRAQRGTRNKTQFARCTQRWEGGGGLISRFSCKTEQGTASFILQCLQYVSAPIFPAFSIAANCALFLGWVFQLSSRSSQHVAVSGGSGGENSKSMNSYTWRLGGGSRFPFRCIFLQDLFAPLSMVQVWKAPQAVPGATQGVEHPPGRGKKALAECLV